MLDVKTGLVGDPEPSITEVNPPTHKQKYLIGQIKYYLGIDFTGNDSDDAYKFINKHYQDVRIKRGI